MYSNDKIDDKKRRLTGALQRLDQHNLCWSRS